MSDLVTNPEDPRLGHGADTTPVEQNKAYLVLSEAERAKGFVRKVRDSYVHVGQKPAHPLRDLTPEEHERYDRFGYVKFEEYPTAGDVGPIGRYWTQSDLDRKACGTLTKMSQALAETYARDPKFYGSTYCVGCRMHRPVAEFVWDGTNEVVGS